MQEIQSDQEIETNAVESLLTEALDNSERSYLLETLQGDEHLTQIFDKLMTRASEFSGDGFVESPVQGGGTDPIPSRLEEGEFVFPRQAVEVIGIETLEAMMNEAISQGMPQAQVAPAKASLLQKPQATR